MVPALSLFRVYHQHNLWSMWLLLIGVWLPVSLGHWVSAFGFYTLVQRFVQLSLCNKGYETTNLEIWKLLVTSFIFWYIAKSDLSYLKWRIKSVKERLVRVHVSCYPILDNLASKRSWTWAVNLTSSSSPIFIDGLRAFGWPNIVSTWINNVVLRCKVGYC